MPRSWRNRSGEITRRRAPRVAEGVPDPWEVDLPDLELPGCHAARRVPGAPRLCGHLGQAGSPRLVRFMVGYDRDRGGCDRPAHRSETRRDLDACEYIPPP